MEPVEKQIVKLLLQAIQETPGGKETLGRLALQQPAVLAALLLIMTNDPKKT